MTSRHIRHSHELDFTIVADVDEYHVTFTIYDIIMWGNDKPVWPRAGQTSSGDYVESLEESEPYLHGFVKWDGCSNWYFDEQDRIMLHGCSREDLQRFGDAMTLCWDWTAELLPTWMP